MNCEERVKAFIASEQLLRSDGRYLVALSGGADSVALLTIMLRLDYSVEAAHCNFMLRGDESRRDEEFVKSLCDTTHTPLHLAHFDTRTYAAIHKVSIEMAARELRYSYFDQLLNDIGADGVCVAHHSNDSVETVLMNLIRGTGIHGLTGIKPRNGRVLRPLLCLSRQDITNYLDDLGQKYVTDSSNLVPDVTRNQIRLQLLPLLQSINPAAIENIETTAHHLAEADKVYQDAIGKALIEIKEKEGRKESEGKDEKDSGIDREQVSVSIPKLLAQPSPESVLFELIHPYGFTSAQVHDVKKLLHATSGKLVSSPTHHLLIDRDKLLIQRQTPPLPTLTIPEPGTYIYNGERRLRLTVTDGASISHNAAIATLDAEKITFPLVLRPVTTGDRFIPFGMSGSRLVSDYLTDRKFTLFDKWQQLAVVDADDNIVWLVGERTDNRYRVDQQTRRTLTLQLSV